MSHSRRTQRSAPSKSSYKNSSQPGVLAIQGQASQEPEIQEKKILAEQLQKLYQEQDALLLNKAQFFAIIPLLMLDPFFMWMFYRPLMRSITHAKHIILMKDYVSFIKQKYGKDIMGFLSIGDQKFGKGILDFLSVDDKDIKNLGFGEKRLFIEAARAVIDYIKTYDSCITDGQPNLNRIYPSLESIGETLMQRQEECLRTFGLYRHILFMLRPIVDMNVSLVRFCLVGGFNSSTALSYFIGTRGIRRLMTTYGVPQDLNLTLYKLKPRLSIQDDTTPAQILSAIKGCKEDNQFLSENALIKVYGKDATFILRAILFIALIGLLGEALYRYSRNEPNFLLDIYTDKRHLSTFTTMALMCLINPARHNLIQDGRQFFKERQIRNRLEDIFQFITKAIPANAVSQSQKITGSNLNDSSVRLEFKNYPLSDGFVKQLRITKIIAKVLFEHNIQFRTSKGMFYFDATQSLPKNATQIHQEICAAINKQIQTQKFIAQLKKLTNLIEVNLNETLLNTEDEFTQAYEFDLPDQYSEYMTLGKLTKIFGDNNVNLSIDGKYRIQGNCPGNTETFNELYNNLDEIRHPKNGVKINGGIIVSPKHNSPLLRSKPTKKKLSNVEQNNNNNSTLSIQSALQEPVQKISWDVNGKTLTFDISDENCPVKKLSTSGTWGGSREYYVYMPPQYASFAELAQRQAIRSHGQPGMRIFRELGHSEDGKGSLVMYDAKVKTSGDGRLYCRLFQLPNNGPRLLVGESFDPHPPCHKGY